MRAITIDRTIPVGKFLARAETLTIDDLDFEFTWSISPPPMRLAPVRDPDTGRTRLEHFFTPLPIWWRIRDASGSEYTENGGSAGPEGQRWRMRFRCEPLPSPAVDELLLTLSEIRPYEDVVEREIETIRVPLLS